MLSADKDVLQLWWVKRFGQVQGGLGGGGLTEMSVKLVWSQDLVLSQVKIEIFKVCKRDLST